MSKSLLDDSLEFDWGQPDYLCRSGKSCKNCPSLSCFPLSRSFSLSLSFCFCVFLLIESICCLKVFFGTTLICLPASQIFHCHMFREGFLSFFLCGGLVSTGWKSRRLFVPRIDKWEAAKVVARVANSAALSTLLLFVYALRAGLLKNLVAPRPHWVFFFFFWAFALKINK